MLTAVNRSPRSSASASLAGTRSCSSAKRPRATSVVMCKRDSDVRSQLAPGRSRKRDSASAIAGGASWKRPSSTAAATRAAAAQASAYSSPVRAASVSAATHSRSVRARAATPPLAEKQAS